MQHIDRLAFEGLSVNYNASPGVTKYSSNSGIVLDYDLILARRRPSRSFDIKWLQLGISPYKDLSQQQVQEVGNFLGTARTLQHLRAVDILVPAMFQGRWKFPLPRLEAVGFVLLRDVDVVTPLFDKASKDCLKAFLHSLNNFSNLFITLARGGAGYPTFSLDQFDLLDVVGGIEQRITSLRIDGSMIHH